MDEQRDDIEDEGDSAAAAFEELRAEVSALPSAIDAILERFLLKAAHSLPRQRSWRIRLA
ncbi:MAG: hypothetical protein C3F11_10315 [Methylocystaceae bacterium]|nr:MAG: hypothetical protein C3F11_10315 [Methylocystaceae bacterium]